MSKGSQKRIRMELTISEDAQPMLYHALADVPPRMRNRRAADMMLCWLAHLQGMSNNTNPQGNQANQAPLKTQPSEAEHAGTGKTPEIIPGHNDEKMQVVADSFGKFDS